MRTMSFGAKSLLAAALVCSAGWSWAADANPGEGPVDSAERDGITYENFFRGTTDNDASKITNWTKANGDVLANDSHGNKAPLVTGSDLWNPALFDGKLLDKNFNNVAGDKKVISLKDVEGWTFKVGAYNNVSVEINNLAKIQGGCWLHVDETSKVTVKSLAAGGKFQNTFDLYVKSQSGFTSEVEFPRNGDSIDDVNYHLYEDGSVTYAALGGNMHHIKSFTLNPIAETKEVKTRQLIAYKSTSGNFSWDDVVVTSSSEYIDFNPVDSVTAEAPLGAYKIEKQDNGIFVKWVAGPLPQGQIKLIDFDANPSLPLTVDDAMNVFVTGRMPSRVAKVVKTMTRPESFYVADIVGASWSVTGPEDGYYIWTLTPTAVTHDNAQVEMTFDGNLNGYPQPQGTGEDDIVYVGSFFGRNQAFKAQSGGAPWTNSNDMVTSGSWTVSHAFYAAELTGKHVLWNFGQSQNSGTNPWIALVWDGTQKTGSIGLHKASTQGVTTEVISKTGLDKTAWHTVTVTYDKLLKKVYLNVDGSEAEVANPTGMEVKAGFQLGAMHGNAYPSGWSRANGVRIDDFRFWKSAQTKAQIDNLLNEGYKGYYAYLTAAVPENLPALKKFGTDETVAFENMLGGLSASIVLDSGVIQPLVLSKAPRANLVIYGAGTLDVAKGTAVYALPSVELKDTATLQIHRNWAEVIGSRVGTAGTVKFAADAADNPLKMVVSDGKDVDPGNLAIAAGTTLWIERKGQENNSNMVYRVTGEGPTSVLKVTSDWPWGITKQSAPSIKDLTLKVEGSKDFWMCHGMTANVVLDIASDRKVTVEPNSLNSNSAVDLAAVTGAGTLNLAGKPVTLNSAEDYTFSGTVQDGSGALTKNGAGTQTFSGECAFGGGNHRTINAGTLSVNLTEDQTWNGTLRLKNGATLVKTGVGTLTLGKPLGDNNSKNSHNGALVISGGALVIGQANGDYSGTVTVERGAAIRMTGVNYYPFTAGTINLNGTLGAATGVNSHISNLVLGDGAMVETGDNVFIVDTALTLNGVPSAKVANASTATPVLKAANAADLVGKAVNVYVGTDKQSGVYSLTAVDNVLKVQKATFATNDTADTSASYTPAAVDAIVAANGGKVPATIVAKAAGEDVNAETASNAMEIFSGVTTNDSTSNTLTIAYDFGISKMVPAGDTVTVTAKVQRSNAGEANAAAFAEGVQVQLWEVGGASALANATATEGGTATFTDVPLATVKGKKLTVKAVKAN